MMKNRKRPNWRHTEFSSAAEPHSWWHCHSVEAGFAAAVAAVEWSPLRADAFPWIAKAAHEYDSCDIFLLPIHSSLFWPYSHSC